MRDTLVLIPDEELLRLASQLTPAELAEVDAELLALPRCETALLNYAALSSAAARPRHDAMELLYNRYYWFAKFVQGHHARYGYDAKLAQQLRRILELAPGEIDRSVIEKLDRKLVVVSVPSSLDDEWQREEPLQLGTVPHRLPTAGGFVTVVLADGSRVRIDLYGAHDECYVFESALVWENFVAIGCGSQAYFFDTVKRTTKRFPLSVYFGSFFDAGELLLVASCTDLLAFDAAGELVWQSETLGIDGVLVDCIEGNTIFGRGEWDPPGGWQPFRLDLRTGREC
jgi:hypothetical protein